MPGEFRYGKFTVELSARIGSFTVPEEIRPSLIFTKGSGFRDTAVRFTGFTVDVRAALMNIVYNTPLDENLQYRNQFSPDFNSSNSPCSRPCFLQDVGPRAFAGEPEVRGCEQLCSRSIYDRTNKFTTDERGLFLDDIVITFTDRGATGVGLKKFTSVVLYNIYTLAVNDQPCIIFRGRTSQGCRERCANMKQPLNCYDSGLPFNIFQPFNATMKEGQLEPILLGGMVTKVVDEYESVRKECLLNLADALSARGEDVVDPFWLIECPRFNTRITAIQGEIALNSREFIEIFLGNERYASPIGFLGFPVDTNAAMRMLRYQLPESNRNFNSNIGTERVTITVKDQGFSGADPSGEFDGTTAESTIEFVVQILPVNNPPEVTVPRPSDPILPPQNSRSQVSLVFTCTCAGPLISLSLREL